jgi:hypothetical protein
MTEYTLPFDKFKVDRKIVTKFIFNILDTFVLIPTLDAKSTVKWLQEASAFEKIIHCDYALFLLQHFTMKQNDLDLTKPNFLTKDVHLWNQELRREVLSIKSGLLECSLNNRQLDIFLNTLDFIEMATMST